MGREEGTVAAEAGTRGAQVEEEGAGGEVGVAVDTETAGERLVAVRRRRMAG